MSKEHRLKTVLDIARLTPDEFKRMVPDLIVWYGLCQEAKKFGAEPVGFTWLDDGKPGVIDSVYVNGVRIEPQ